MLSHSLFLRADWEVSKQWALEDNVVTSSQACNVAEEQFQQKCGQKRESQTCSVAACAHTFPEKLWPDL